MKHYLCFYMKSIYLFYKIKENQMKLIKTMALSASVILASCSGGSSQSDAPVIGKSNPKIENGRLNPEALWGMGRIGSVDVSPDNQKVLYTVSYYSIPEDKGNTELFVINTDGTNNQQLTTTSYSEYNAIWIKEGNKIAYLSSESGSSQIWEMNPDGTGRKQLSNFENSIEGFSLSPDGQKILFISQVPSLESTADKHPDLPKSTGKVIDDLMYKHWDEWVTTAPHPFVADFDGQKLTNIKDIMEGEVFQSPLKPFGDIEQLAWNTTSDKVAYTSKKKTGVEYALSTNSDIYIYDLATGTTENITEGMMGYDMNPQYSPDGKYIAWQSMERDGYEADWNRLFIMNIETGEKQFVSESFKSNVDSFCWNAEGNGLYFVGNWHARTHIYFINLETSTIKQITAGDYDYISVAPAGEQLIAKRQSLSSPDEIYAVQTNGEAKQLTQENKHICDQLTMGKVEERWIKTTDGKEMLTWVVYPPHFDASKKYPTLLYCQGGPQSTVSQFWSVRWNLQIMAANDYIIVAPNRRGLPGFGLEWNEAISGDYGGQCMRDYFSAIDEVAKEPYVDEDRLGCVGASFGGFSVYWLAGHHNKRFKAFIAHDGIFNMEMQYLETEEMWFANWDMGGAYWEKDNATAQRTFANSPHRFVDKWDTPILCIHGEKDYRILANQGMAPFNAAKLRGIPAELLIFPDENHWVLKPQNGILWQRTFFNWLDRWLK